MILALLLAGFVLVASGLKGTNHELGQQLQQDVLGPGGFILWAAAIIGIGMIGFVPYLRQPSRYLLALLLVVVVLSNRGVFAQAQQALQGALSAGPAPSVPLAGGDSSSSSSGSGSNMSTVATVASLFLA